MKSCIGGPRSPCRPPLVAKLQNRLGGLDRSLLLGRYIGEERGWIGRKESVWGFFLFRGDHVCPWAKSRIGAIAKDTSTIIIIQETVHFATRIAWWKSSAT